jgi:hypothetical protein
MGRQHNGQKRKRERTNNDLQNITQRPKDRVTGTFYLMYVWMWNVNIFQSLEIDSLLQIYEKAPNILKFKQITSAYQNQNLEKLCKFIRNINKSCVL